MATVDISTIIQSLEGLLATVITGLLVVYIPKGLAAFQAHTGIVLTENQRQTFLGAAQTAAGILETRLDQGHMGIEHINVTNAAVANQAQAVIDAVPAASRALGMTPAGAARILIGMVDTASHPGPVPAAQANVPVVAAGPGDVPLKTWLPDPVPAIPPVPKT